MKKIKKPYKIRVFPFGGGKDWWVVQYKTFWLGWVNVTSRYSYSSFNYDLFSPNGYVTDHPLIGHNFESLCKDAEKLTTVEGWNNHIDELQKSYDKANKILQEKESVSYKSKYF